MIDFINYENNYPDSNGMFGKYGGSYLSDELNAEFRKLADAYAELRNSDDFLKELQDIRTHFQGRPTPVYFCERLSNANGGGKIYLKREDLNHTGAHKLNHCMGEALFAKKLGKKKLIAETGAGQHGVAIATAAAYFGLECEVHMGEVDIKKQASNVSKMKVLGAKIISVNHGLKSLKEAVDSAFDAYLKCHDDALYCIGSTVGPHPFPVMVRDFQSVVGREAKQQFVEMTGKLPDMVCACVGGGSNSAGMFIPFLAEQCKIVGIEPLGKGKELGKHAASLSFGEEGIMHGFNSLMLKDKDGNPAPVYSVASGLDYPSSGPEHAFLKDSGRVIYDTISDEEAIDAFFKLSRTEGIIPAVESAHAVAYAIKQARENKDLSVLVNLSGRGDKDVDFVIENFGYGD